MTPPLLDRVEGLLADGDDRALTLALGLLSLAAPLVEACLDTMLEYDLESTLRRARLFERAVTMMEDAAP